MALDGLDTGLTPVRHDGVEQGHDAAETADRVTVFYDGACPVCRREIAFYTGIDDRKCVEWSDIARLDGHSLPPGKTMEDLLARLHVLDDRGVWTEGVTAFAVIWRRLPVFRHFAWLLTAPLFRSAAEACYRLFLIWQRRDRARRLSRTGRVADAA